MSRCARKANSEMATITTITAISTIFQTGVPAAAIATSLVLARVLRELVVPRLLGSLSLHHTLDDATGTADRLLPASGSLIAGSRPQKDAAGLAVGLVIEHRDLAGATPGDDPFAFRSDSPILAER